MVQHDPRMELTWSWRKANGLACPRVMQSLKQTVKSLSVAWLEPALLLQEIFQVKQVDMSENNRETRSVLPTSPR